MIQWDLILSLVAAEAAEALLVHRVQLVNLLIRFGLTKETQEQKKISLIL